MGGAIFCNVARLSGSLRVSPVAFLVSHCAVAKPLFLIAVLRRNQLHSICSIFFLFIFPSASFFLSLLCSLVAGFGFVFCWGAPNSNVA